MTTLLIELPRVKVATAVALRECMTTTALFETTIREWDLQNKAGNVKWIGIIFEWADAPIHIRCGNDNDYRCLIQGFKAWLD
ncbi:MAG: hypothetical protein M1812_005682 [Candelaria pacifica]|nr:MAG: hypothetical protein M1812_005682 [Candelaria pacifica]